MPRQHSSQSVKGLLKTLEGMHFVIHDKTKKGTVKIEPPEAIGGGPYFTHATESSYHQLRRDIKKKYGVDLTARV